MKKAFKSFFLALIKYVALQLEIFYEKHVDIDDPSYIEILKMEGKLK